MLNNSYIEKSIRCDCIGGEHYLHFIYFKDDPQLYIDLNAKTKFKLIDRIKKAWEIIIGKDSCYDGIILENEKQKEIVKFLTEKDNYGR